jgi:signal transduction histidine kinase
MSSQDVKRWLGSRFATSWQLMLLLLANYVLNGRLFASVELLEGGPPSFVYDLYNSVSMILVLFVFRYIKIVNPLIKSFCGFISASAVSNFPLLFVLPLFFETVDTDSQSYRSFVGISSLGFLQAILVQVLLTMLLASFSESRSERKKLAVQRAKLLYLKETLEEQINEVVKRIELDVKAKLLEIIKTLQENMEASVKTAAMARMVSDALNEGIRPLSWQVSSQPENTPDFSKVKPLRGTLRQRYSFKVELGKSTSVIFALAIMAVYDLPLILFVYGSQGIPAGLISISIVVIGLFAVTRLGRRLKVNSVIALLLMTILAGVLGTSFIGFRAVTGLLSPDLSEIGIVISFMQINLALSWFQITVERRKVSIQKASSVNMELEILVSRLRQSAWLEKQKLARIVHGPVQSTLFSTYLQLSQTETIDPDTRKKIAGQLDSANQAISAAYEVQRLSFQQVTAQLTEGWGAALKFSVEASQETSDLIDQSPVTKACAIEVLRESINNAAKYGNGDVAISIEQVGSELIKIQVVNQTQDQATTQKSGFGSKILDEVTHSWDLRIKNSQAVFTALIAISK